MSAAAKAPPSKVKKERDREKDRKLHPATERLKTVVRRLPPNLPEDVFWKSVEAWVTDETVTWKAFYGGKTRKRLNKESITSRAYIAFKNQEQLALFSQAYDGHTFRDKAGNESYAVVEFAPHQKIPTEKKKVDARNATIEQDEDYISFLESLKAPTNPEPVSLEALIAASQPPPPPKTTPLLEALKAEKSAHKDKEAILRNHAHYKDATILTGTPRKDESKKKASAQKAAEFAPGGKKASKKSASAPSSAQKPPPPGNNTIKTPGPPNASSKPAKPPKPPRPPPQAKPSQSTPKPAVASANTGPTSATPSVTNITSTTQGDSGTATMAPPRRARPVIGLASRQFEAALSGVGVTAAIGERKSRREREREREREKTIEMGGTVGSGAAAAPPPGDAKPSPPSPRRVRHHRDAPPESNAPGASLVTKVPGILQRTDGPPPAIMQREAPRVTEGGHLQDTVPPIQSTAGGGGGGGGGRGGRRGRGRGRGGNPGLPRGG